MSSLLVPDEQTYYSSQRHDDVDALAWPVFSQRALDLLRSAGEVLHPEPGELLWDTGDAYDLYLVLAGGVLLLDRRDDRVVLRVRVEELRRLVEISGELSDVLLSAFDARPCAIRLIAWPGRGVAMSSGPRSSGALSADRGTMQSQPLPISPVAASQAELPRRTASGNPVNLRERRLRSSRIRGRVSAARLNSTATLAWQERSVVAGAAVDAFAEQVGVAVMARVLLDHVGDDPAQ